ncbi:serine-rich adhesin for platelets-like isoform X2 [Labeo rohita]|uniref:Serine-rich adhesin for platelets-like isoform X2 n=1 Tax=Labeo rohita TaxID=84645 RepID=A0A498P6G1_LABRO|nr:serine-rich adhesin for platelets-like isoform X2 [Labeo rohita]
MAHRSQCSSAGDNPLDPNYLPPHYREEYRMAVDALVEADLEGYYGFLQEADVVDFLARSELEYIKRMVKAPHHTAQPERRYMAEDVDGSSDTYWPVHSDHDAPSLDLGWPQHYRFVGPTEVTTLVNPSDPEMPSIKEQVRRMIKNAQQLVTTFDEEFRILFAHSEPLVVENVLANMPHYGGEPESYYNTEKSQMFNRKYPTMGMEWAGRTTEDQMKLGYKMLPFRSESIHSASEANPSVQKHMNLHAAPQFRGDPQFIEHGRQMRGPNEMAGFKRHSYGSIPDYEYMPPQSHPTMRGNQYMEGAMPQGGQFGREPCIYQGAGLQSGYDVYGRFRGQGQHIDQFSGPGYTREGDEAEPPGAYDHIQRYLQSQPAMEEGHGPRNALPPVQSNLRRHSMGQSYACQTSPTQPNPPEQKRFFNASRKPQDVSQKQGLRDWRISSYLSAYDDAGELDLVELEGSSACDDIPCFTQEAPRGPVRAEIRPGNREFNRIPSPRENPKFVQIQNDSVLPDILGNPSSDLSQINIKTTPASTSESSCTTEGDKVEETQNREPKETSWVSEEFLKRKPSRPVQRSSRLRHSLIFSSNLELNTPEDMKDTAGEKDGDEASKLTARVSQILDKRRTGSPFQPFQWSSFGKSATFDNSTSESAQPEDELNKTVRANSSEHPTAAEMGSSQFSTASVVDSTQHHMAKESTQPFIQPIAPATTSSQHFSAMETDSSQQPTATTADSSQHRSATGTNSSQEPTQMETHPSQKPIAVERDSSQLPTAAATESSLQSTTTVTDSPQQPNAIEANPSQKSIAFETGTSQQSTASMVDAMKQLTASEADTPQSHTATESDLSTEPFKQLPLLGAGSSQQPTATTTGSLEQSSTTDSDSSQDPNATVTDSSQQPAATVVGSFQMLNAADKDSSQQSTSTDTDSSQQPIAAEIVLSQQPIETFTDSSLKSTSRDTDSSQQPTATNVDSSREITAADTDSSRTSTATEVDFSQEITAADTDSSKTSTATEVDSSREITAVDTDSSKTFTATEVDFSREITAADTDSSKTSTATEVDSSREITAADTDSSQTSTATEVDSSQKITAADTDSSQMSTATEVDSSRGITAADTDSSQASTATEVDPSQETTSADTDSSQKSTATETDSCPEPIAAVTDTSQKSASTDTDSSQQPTATDTDSSQEPTAKETDSSQEPTAKETDSFQQPIATEDSFQELTAKDTDSFQQPVATQVDSSREPSAAETDSSPEPTAAATDTSQESTAQITDSSQLSAAAEIGSSWESIAADTDSSYYLTATDTDFSDTDSSQQLAATETDTSQKMTATTTDSFQQSFATEIDSSQQLTITESGFSQNPTKMETDTSKLPTETENEPPQDITTNKPEKKDENLTEAFSKVIPIPEVNITQKDNSISQNAVITDLSSSAEHSQSDTVTPCDSQVELNQTQAWAEPCVTPTVKHSDSGALTSLDSMEVSSAQPQGSPEPCLSSNEINSTQGIALLQSSLSSNPMESSCQNDLKPEKMNECQKSETITEQIQSHDTSAVDAGPKTAQIEVSTAIDSNEVDKIKQTTPEVENTVTNLAEVSEKSHMTVHSNSENQSSVAENAKPTMSAHQTSTANVISCSNLRDDTKVLLEQISAKNQSRSSQSKQTATPNEAKKGEVNSGDKLFSNYSGRPWTSKATPEEREILLQKMEQMRKERKVYSRFEAVITVMKQNAQSEGISHTDTDINLLMKDWFTQCLFLFKM